MRILLWVCLSSILIVCYSCGNKDVKKEAPALATPQIKNINFFMETSGSMAGYLNGSTDFVKAIPNLLIAIEKNVDSGKLKIHNYYIADSALRFNGSTEDFIYAISTKPVAKAKSSEMHRIFKMIADKTDSNDISMFVSDCILSYSDKDIAASPGRNINRDKAEGGLKPFITSAFNQLQKKNDMCASLYGFNSDFDGTYYTYQNGIISIKKGEVVRPYYLWVIGNRELLTQFNAELYKIENFKPDIAMNFGIFDKPVSDYHIFFRYKKSGNWQAEDNGINEADIKKTQPITAAVGVNLASLPPYAKDTNYLHQNLKLAKGDADFKIISIVPTDDIRKTDLKKNEIDDLSASTHVFVIEIDGLYKPKADLQIGLPLHYDTSYRKISIMDDKNKADISGKTFAFEHLVDGVRAAYQNSNQNYINITIPIKK